MMNRRELVKSLGAAGVVVSVSGGSSLASSIKKFGSIDAHEQLLESVMKLAIFETNDDYTRHQINSVHTWTISRFNNTFYREVKDYTFQCDKHNNYSKLVDLGLLRADLVLELRDQAITHDGYAYNTIVYNYYLLSNGEIDKYKILV